MPSLAHCVDFSTNTNSNRPSLKPPPEAIRFPTIHKKQPRRLSEILQQTMHPHATRRTAATANATRIFARKATQKQHRATHILPQLSNSQEQNWKGHGRDLILHQFTELTSTMYKL